MVFKVFFWDILFTDHFASQRCPGTVDALLFAAHQRVPPGQISALPDQPVGAGRRQPPGNSGQTLWRQSNAPRDQSKPVGIARTPAGLKIEQAASRVCVKRWIGPIARLVGVLVNQFDEAAFGAAIAQGFPLAWAHGLKGHGFPKWRHDQALRWEQNRTATQSAQPRCDGAGLFRSGPGQARVPSGERLHDAMIKDESAS